ncbi:C2 domain containing protein [Trema orientale]|uniref:C2 domain containing protein n=1 Tax=Trema orientale TaxID=63057 RepID=A0A2P5FVT8_TREOI|nr:C2 domain containing protein [Trema orientale]
MDSSSVELKLMYGEDLRAFNFFQKLSVFVLASIATDDPTKKVENNQLQRTPTDREGDGNPEWNHEMRFLIGKDSDSGSDHLFLHLDLRHDGVLFGIGDRTIGEVRIPLKDLMDEASSNGVVRFVRYQVKGSDGKPNGVLNLSYKFNSRSGKKPLNPNKIQYPTVEEIPNLDLQVPTLSFPRQSHWSSPSSLSFSGPERQGIDCWPPRPDTVSYPQIHVPQAGPGSGHHHYHHHGGVMWRPRGSVMGDWNGL